MERGVLTGIAALRWAAWAWLAVVLVIAEDPLAHPIVAGALAGAALVWTVLTTVALRARPAALVTPAAIVAELAIGCALRVGDGWVYEGGHAFAGSQSLGSAWPLAGVLSAGAVFGPVVAGIGGLALGVGNTFGAVANGVDHWDGGRYLSVTSTAVLYVLAGVVAGFAATQLRIAERTVSVARAREEVARTLHDGVLQTLAVVQRRAADPALVRLAHDQERELRAFLSGFDAGDTPDLASALRREAARFEERFEGRVRVVVADDLPGLARHEVQAVAGAVGEALTNAGKHGATTTVTVYAEPASEARLFCSVKDDGGGFDAATVVAGEGTTRSIRGRVEEIGGRVEIDGRAGNGTEVRLWLP